MVSEPTAGSSPRREIAGAAWRLAISSTVRLVLLSLLALSFLLGSLLPQLPSELASDPEVAVVTRWLSSSAERFGTWGSFLLSVGLFEIGHSVWFRLLLVALAFHFLIGFASAVQTACNLLRRSTCRIPIPSEIPYRATVSLVPPLEEAAGLLEAGLESRGFRMLSEDSHDPATSACVYGDRARSGLLGPVLSNAGCLVLLLGLFLESGWGWRSGSLLLAPGQEGQLGLRPGLSLRLDSSPIDGSPAQVLVHDVGRVTTRTVAPARPARVGSLYIYQIGKGPALVVAAEDAGGTSLRLQPLAGGATDGNRVSLVFDQPQAERHVTIPDHNLALRVVAQTREAEGKVDNVSFRVQAYQGGSSQPILETSVAGSKALLEVGEARVSLSPESYLELQVSRRPGLPWLLAGGLLIAVGVILPQLRPTLQVWAELTAQRRAVAVSLLGRAHGATIDAELELERLVQALGG